MSRLKIYDSKISRAAILHERAMQYRTLSTSEKLKRLFQLIQLSVAMNNNQPIKKPQGKGIVFYKK